MTQVFDIFAKLMLRETGMNLYHDQDYFLASRLMPVMRRYNLPDLQALADRQNDHDLRTAVIEALMTHETSFMRDVSIFDHIRNVMLPELIARNADTKTLRIWSAGCATGQEPYSLAMLLDEFHLHDWDVLISATDISHQAIDFARTGIYTRFDVQRGLSIRYLLEHFNQCDAEHWQVNDKLKRSIVFRQANLLNDFPDDNPFDLIFCRNVLIYFDMTTRRDILKRMNVALAPYGFLILGSVETALTVADPWIDEGNIPGIYRREISG